MAADLKDFRITPVDDAEDFRLSRLDGKTEAVFRGEPLPTSIRIDLPPQLAVVLAAVAFCEDRSVEYIAAQTLLVWADGTASVVPLEDIVERINDFLRGTHVVSINASL